MSTHPFDELEQLLLDWECGDLDRSGVERLRQLLRNDAAAQEHFLQLQMLSTALRAEAGSGLPHDRLSEAADVGLAERDHDKNHRSAGALFGYFAAAALVLVALGFSFAQFRAGTNQQISNEVEPRQKAEATSSGVALLTRLVDATWPADSPALREGDALNPGVVSVTEGLAQIEFFCGATLIVQGPAELELKSSVAAVVRHGKVRAQVPPAARGFTLTTDDMRVVDLGTEFGLSVSENGTEVQVFDGEVELERPEMPNQSLFAGQGLKSTSGGEFESTTAEPDDYVDIEVLETRAAEQNQARYQQWQKWSHEQRRDPRLITYYALEATESWNRKLPQSLVPPAPELDGAIVGARRVNGRWDAKGALEFKRPGDRVRVQIPGEFGSLTFACWARIDSLDRQFNSLFLTDGYDAGEPHWQLLDSGQIYFSVRPAAPGTNGPVDFKALSEPFWKPSMSGEWIHLATTLDIDSGEVVHFLNGQRLSRQTIPKNQLPQFIRFGTSSIGNWSQPTQTDSVFAIRNLNGSIDELAIYSAALSGDEISEMYSNGRP